MATSDSNVVSSINDLLENYISASLYTAICESKICEQISRKNAMTQATKNKDEKIFELKLLYNKRRQEKITNEVAILSSSQGATC
jgi:F-type H+-transporting ATPase subunit gamma